MSETNTSILYFLSEWFDNEQQKSVTFYRDTQDNYVVAIIKSKWNKIVKRKKFRLIGQPEPISQMWWGWNRPTIEESFATADEVNAYFKRRKRKGKKGSLRGRYIPQKSLKQLQIDGAKLYAELFEE